jgi:dTMP kinase
MDLGLSHDPIDSFRTFQQRLLNEYDALVDAFALWRLDATLPVKQQQRLLREAVEKTLPGE